MTPSSFFQRFRAKPIGLVLCLALVVLVGIAVRSHIVKQRGSGRVLPPVSDHETTGSISPPVVRVEGRGDATPGTAKNGVAGVRYSQQQRELARMVGEYKALVAELDAELSDYRTSLPVFQQFAELFTETVVPLAMHGEEARIKLMEERLRDEKAFKEQFKYDGKKAEQAMHQIASALYRDIAMQAEKLVHSGDVVLKEEEARLFLTVVEQIKKHGNVVTDPKRYRNPYEEGTLEHEEFKRNLALATLQYTGAVTKPLLKLPVDLEEKQRKADALYDRIVSQAPPGTPGLPTKYVDPYLDSLNRVYKKVGELTEAYRQLEQMKKALRREAEYFRKGGSEP